MAEFEKKIADFVETNPNFKSADKILLAVSGGADSIALLYVMTALKAKGILKGELICAHINHCLRGEEGDTDQEFVKEQTADLNLKLITRQINVKEFAEKNKLSVETAGRKLRIQALCDIAADNNCSSIATAHHADDNAETILHRLSRGTGFRGLAGIWPVKKFDQLTFVRPLLFLRRSEIIKYLEGKNLKWRTDKTNTDCIYRRNFIRHRLLPDLQQHCKTSIVEQLSKLSCSTRRFNKMVSKCANNLWPKMVSCDDYCVKLKIPEFQKQHREVKVELIRKSLLKLGSGQRNLTKLHFDRVLELCEKNQSGKKIELPSGFTVYRQYGELVLGQSLKIQNVCTEAVKINVPGKTKFTGYCIEASIIDMQPTRLGEFKAKKDKFIEYMDLEKVKLPLEVRSRKPGDRFQPLGLAGEKKVGKFLTNEKLPQELREKILIIKDLEKIIWVSPVRISEDVKVTHRTRKVLKLKVT